MTSHLPCPPEDTEPNAGNRPTASDSFIATFLRLLPALRHTIRKIVLHQQDTDDLLQEAFARGMQAQQTQAIRSLDDYLFILTRNLALQERSRQINPLIELMEDWDLALEPSDQDNPENLCSDRERFNAFLSAVNSLPAQCQRAFLLKHLHGLSQRDIAADMGISQSTVEKHLAKGLLRCATELEAIACLEPLPGKGYKRYLLR